MSILKTAILGLFATAFLTACADKSHDDAMMDKDSMMSEEMSSDEPMGKL